MEITMVKAARPGDQDRAYLQAGGVTRHGPVHVAHDLPHLVVESLSGIHDGLGAEPARGSHRAAADAAAARDLRRAMTRRPPGPKRLAWACVVPRSGRYRDG